MKKIRPLSAGSARPIFGSAHASGHNSRERLRSYWKIVRIVYKNGKKTDDHYTIEKARRRLNQRDNQRIAAYNKLIRILRKNDYDFDAPEARRAKEDYLEKENKFQELINYGRQGDVVVVETDEDKFARLGMRT